MVVYIAILTILGIGILILSALLLIELGKIEPLSISISIHRKEKNASKRICGIGTDDNYLDFYYCVSPN